MSGHSIQLSKTRSGSVSNLAKSPTIERREPNIDPGPGSPPKKSRTDSNVSAATTVVAEDEVKDKGLKGSPIAERTIEWDADLGDTHQVQNSQESQMDVDVIKEIPEPQGDNSNGLDSTQGEAQPQASEEESKDNPPPVPPRPVGKSQIEEYARQQDVEEVMGNVFHQLQWAVKPEDVDADGNQQDLISRCVSTNAACAIRKLTFAEPFGES